MTFRYLPGVLIQDLGLACCGFSIVLEGIWRIADGFNSLVITKILLIFFL